MPVAQQRWRKALRILIGIVLMGGFVVVVFVVLSRYAGAWGVPYFSFTTERGSTCTNDFAGYTCTELTLAEVEYFGQFDLPDDTTVLQGRYRSTHDYQLEALLSVPPASRAAALKSLHSNFGPCVNGPAVTVGRPRADQDLRAWPQTTPSANPASRPVASTASAPAYAKTGRGPSRCRSSRGRPSAAAPLRCTAAHLAVFRRRRKGGGDSVGVRWRFGDWDSGSLACLGRRNTARFARHTTPHPVP